MKYLFPMIILLLVTQTAFANRGEFTLCEKVKMASEVVEMEFKTKDAQPQWGDQPDRNNKLKIAKTGKVTHVFKGSLKAGDSWVIDMPTPFEQLNSTEKWKEILSHDQFRVFVFMLKAQAGYNPIGGLEEKQFCEKSAHYSWCLGYSNFIAGIKQCLANTQ